jgi:pimeloyl-ACP methyl ester carboxylesterase
MLLSGKVHNEGADIAWYKEGQGPFLLLIPGGNGDSRLYQPLSAELASRYTVIRCDRRANASSTGDIQAELDMAQQARDVAAVIREVAGEKAFVFGSSAGANIALALTQDHPQWVRGLVAHEPPVTDMLPDAAMWRTFFDGVYQAFQEKGAADAMKMFASSFVGFDKNMPAPADQSGSHERFLAHEFNIINRFVPDMPTLRRGGVPMVTGVGRASGDAFYAQTAHELARLLPCPCADFIGNHVGYTFSSTVFASELDSVLQSLLRA